MTQHSFDSLRFTRPRKCISLLGASILILFCLTQTSRAVTNTKMLMLYPLRTIFTDKQRSLNTYVINRGNEVITYSISLVTMREDSNGQLYEPATETQQEKFIKSLIRYSPRRATIQPEKRQLVKMMVRKPKDLPMGEYKTFVRLTPHPSPTKDSPEQVQRNENDSPKINVELLVSSSMPIIIQHGIGMGEITPHSIQLTQTADHPSGVAAKITLQRAGKGSAFGHVYLDYIPKDAPGNPREIGRIQGLAFYQPETEKTLTVPLKDTSRQQLKKGSIRVRFVPSTGVITKRRKQRNISSSSKDFQLP